MPCNNNETLEPPVTNVEYNIVYRNQNAFLRVSIFAYIVHLSYFIVGNFFESSYFDVKLLGFFMNPLSGGIKFRFSWKKSYPFYYTYEIPPKDDDEDLEMKELSNDQQDNSPKNEIVTVTENPDYDNSDETLNFRCNCDVEDSCVLTDNRSEIRAYVFHCRRIDSSQHMFKFPNGR